MPNIQRSMQEGEDRIIDLMSSVKASRLPGVSTPEGRQEQDYS